jgi:hypothetical protein
LSLAVYFVFTFFKRPSEDVDPNPMLLLILLGVAVATTLLSFLMKSKLLNRAIQQQQVSLVQQGYIVAWALCEVGGLLGVLGFFVTGDRYYYVLLFIGLLGQLLHVPRREHVVNALGKTSIF